MNVEAATCQSETTHTGETTATQKAEKIQSGNGQATVAVAAAATAAAAVAAACYKMLIRAAKTL